MDCFDGEFEVDVMVLRPTVLRWVGRREREREGRERDEGRSRRVVFRDRAEKDH